MTTMKSFSTIPTVVDAAIVETQRHGRQRGSARVTR